MKYLVALMLCCTAASSSLSVPYHFSYFNELSGGSANGRYHLLHSNLDWGQGLLGLDELLEAHPDWGPVGIVYSGPISPIIVGSRTRPVDLNDWASVAKFSHIAISANYLMRQSKSSQGSNEYSVVEELRKTLPVESLDGSILVFETADLNVPATDDPPIYGLNLQGDLNSLPSLADSTGVKSVSGLLHILILHRFENTSLSGMGMPKSGMEAFRILTDERIGKSFFGDEVFIRTRNGIRYPLVGRKSGDGWRGESHRDQCLSVFAMLDLPTDTPLRLEKGEATLQDLITESIANFTFEQGEMNWTALAYAHYLPPARQWTNRFGETVTFSDLANHLMDTGYIGQSCGGLHVLQAISELEIADDRFGLFDRPTRIRCRRFMNDALEQIMASQLSDGSWRYQWYADPPESEPTDDKVVERRIVVTGHMLEFLHGISHRVSLNVLADATNWMADTLRNRLPKTIDVCPLTHAIRGVLMSADRNTISR